MNLTIIFPAHNEERRIGPTLESYLDFFDGALRHDYELLIVLNGCQDGTLSIVEGFASRRPDAVRHLLLDQRLGKGGAIFEGFRHARGARIAYTDADGIIPPTELAKAVSALDEGIAAVVGTRSRQLGIARPPLRRRIASAGFRWLTGQFPGITVQDPQCPAKVLRREAVEALLPHLSVTGWACDIDILLGCTALELPVREVPVTWVYRGGSRLHLWKAVPEMVRSLLKLRGKWRRVTAKLPERGLYQQRRASDRGEPSCSGREQ